MKQKINLFVILYGIFAIAFFILWALKDDSNYIIMMILMYILFNQERMEMER